MARTQSRGRGAKKPGSHPAVWGMRERGRVQKAGCKELELAADHQEGRSGPALSSEFPSSAFKVGLRKMRLQDCEPRSFWELELGGGISVGGRRTGPKGAHFLKGNFLEFNRNFSA